MNIIQIFSIIGVMADAYNTGDLFTLEAAQEALAFVSKAGQYDSVFKALVDLLLRDLLHWAASDSVTDVDRENYKFVDLVQDGLAGHNSFADARELSKPGLYDEEAALYAEEDYERRYGYGDRQ